VTGLPLLLYVPGLLPKPEPRVHAEALLRCLVAGVRRVDSTAGAGIAAEPRCFDVVSWTYDFYGEYRDFAIDAAAVDAVIEQPAASRTDRAQASSLRRRLIRRMFLLGDRLPFLIPHIANERMQLHLRDLRRYLRNRNDIAEHVRQMLKMALRAAAEAQRPILLIGHSMGSVIAYDSLWQMTHGHRDHVRIGLLLTMGSPLGQRFIQSRLAGCDRRGAARYPGNFRRWINLTARGDLTAVDPTLADDFSEMVELGLVESIEDFEVHNYFRLAGELNVHAEYGYLVNEVTAGIVAEWWRSCPHTTGPR
jgi:hypothetical protein